MEPTFPWSQSTRSFLYTRGPFILKPFSISTVLSSVGQTYVGFTSSASSQAPQRHLINMLTSGQMSPVRLTGVVAVVSLTHQNNEPHSIVHLLTLLSLHYGGASDRQHDWVYLAGLRCQRHSLDCGSQPDAAYKNQDKCALKQELLT